MNVLARFGVDDGHNNLAEEPEGDEPLLGIGEPIVLVCVGQALECLLCVAEIESCFLRFLRRFGSSPVITCRLYILNAYASRKGDQRV